MDSRKRGTAEKGRASGNTEAPAEMPVLGPQAETPVLLSSTREQELASRRPPGLDEIKVVRMDRTHGGAVPDGVIDFSASINPLGVPRQALEEYHAAATVISSYPPAYAEKLSARLAEWLGIGRRKIIVGNGSTQLIHLFTRVYQVRFPHIAIPTFSEFANAIALSS